MNDESVSGILLFGSFFLIYGLEYLFPLTIGKRDHFWMNIGCAVFVFTVNVASTSATLAVADWVAVNRIGLLHVIDMPFWLAVIVSAVFLDLWAGYLPHLLMHRIVFLWHFHSIHHSDDHVDVTTTFRKHPVESMVGIFFNLTGMIILGLSAWILLIYLTLSTLHAQIGHANISIGSKWDRILQRVFVTPNMHKVHHAISEKESDSNFSNIFSFWDRAFHTYRRRKRYSGIRYGLDYLPRASVKTFWHLLKLPLTSARLFRARKSKLG